MLCDADLPLRGVTQENGTQVTIRTAHRVDPHFKVDSGVWCTYFSILHPP